jgi:hypothetical protein
MYSFAILLIVAVHQLSAFTSAPDNAYLIQVGENAKSEDCSIVVMLPDEREFQFVVVAILKLKFL